MKTLTLTLCAAMLAAGAWAGNLPSKIDPLGRLGMTAAWTPASLSPVAWYRGEGNALDSSANGFDGTWVGDAAYTNVVNGQAFNFATSNYVSVANNAALSGFNAFTAAFWVRSKSASSPSANQYILGTYVTTGNQRSWALLRSSIGVLHFNPSTNGAVAAAVGFDGLAFDATWHHVALVRLGENVVYYLDGSAKSTNTLSHSTAVFASSGVTTIGALTAGNHFFGAVDDVLIFNRALTPAEITQLYNWRQP
jgi:hypothetical protein